MQWRAFWLAGLAVLIPANTAFGTDLRYDRSIEAAAARIAASKLGDIRGPIAHDETPSVTRKSQPRLMQPAPRPDPDRISRSQEVMPTPDGIDSTHTASVKRAPKRVIWDRFDRYGNPIE